MTTAERWLNSGTERAVEIPWLLRTISAYPALDVGSHESVYLHDLGGPVDGIDVRPAPEGQPLRQFFHADIRTWQAPEKYPTIIALSTIEHIGLEFAPYGTLADDEDGDRHAIEGCMRNLTADGSFLLTVPFGHTYEHRGWYRRYDGTSLNELLDGYLIYNATYQIEPRWDVGGVACVTVKHR